MQAGRGTKRQEKHQQTDLYTILRLDYCCVTDGPKMGKIFQNQSAIRLRERVSARVARSKGNYCQAGVGRREASQHDEHAETSLGMMIYIRTSRQNAQLLPSSGSFFAGVGVRGQKYTRLIKMRRHAAAHIQIAKIVRKLHSCRLPTADSPARRWTGCQTPRWYRQQNRPRKSKHHSPWQQRRHQ